MTEPKRLQNVCVVAKKPGELHAFYEGALGLKLKFRDGDRWIQYGVGNGNVSLACEEEAAPATSGLVMVFEVEDFTEAQQRVTAVGGVALRLHENPSFLLTDAMERREMHAALAYCLDVELQ